MKSRFMAFGCLIFILAVSTVACTWVLYERALRQDAERAKTAAENALFETRMAAEVQRILTVRDEFERRHAQLNNALEQRNVPARPIELQSPPIQVPMRPRPNETSHVI